ncbi:hypothetical protein GCM10010401_19890 [Rarobacter faecitabidus]|nr:glucodextranase DOMON-like domain-containing protein [Rarobacter faecitabidus]
MSSAVALTVAIALSGGSLAATAANAQTTAPASQDAGDWVLTSSNPFTDSYHPTFTGNGYFAARIPATGQGFSTHAVPTSFEINGLFTGRDVADIADDNAGNVSKQWRVSGPGWTGLTVADDSGSFDEAFDTPCIVGNACQLEDAALSGGLGKATNHRGYKGSGFVDNWGNVGATARLSATGMTAGTQYDVVVRYAAGWPGSDVVGNRALTLSVGGVESTIELPSTPEWDQWAEVRQTVAFDATRAPVALSCKSGQDCRVNVDQLAIVPVGAATPENSSTPTMADRGLAGYAQALDLKTGAITTAATWTSPSGRVTDVKYTVLTDRSHDQRGVVRVEVTPQWSGQLTVTDVLDARPTEQVKEFTPHRDAATSTIGLTTELNHTDLSATYASTLAGPGVLSATAQEAISDDSIGQTLTAPVTAGETYEFVKFVGLTTSDDDENSYSAAAVIAAGAKSSGYASVRAANDAAWDQIWQGDIQVKGNDELQSQIRASRFYLIASVGERAWSPSPTGLSSNNYGGHAFWDTETWMWPSLLAQNPDIAAGVLQYRSDRIDDAAWNAANTLERKASQQGNDNAAMNNFERVAYDGIRFPWEGGYTGRESTESYFFGGHEIHITADVALAFWQYYLATGDEQWLADKGWPIISGTADFWVSRSTLGSDGKYHVLNVTPPDEWASNGNRGRDDNPYTNVAASKNIEIALQAAQILGHAAKPAWSARAGHYYIPMDDSRGVALEYADYDGRTIKQADVVMLTYPWEHAQSTELTGRNLDYYSTKVDEHASPSMTDAMHSIVAAELGRAEEAYWYTQRSAGGFLRGEFNQFTEERSGGHAFTFITGAGGFLQEFYYGYTGLRWRDDGIALNPVLPSALDEIKLTGMKYQGSTFDIEIGPASTTVTVTGGGPLTIEGAGTASVGSPLSIDTRKSVDSGNDDGYGTLIGTLSAEPGNDNGPGTYVYPGNDVFTEGSFDMTDFKVYRDGDKVNLVTRVNGEILNPWALEAMSLQLVHAYIRTADATTTGVTPALTGTNVNTESPWQYVAIANPRQQGGSIGGTGLYDAAGNLVGQATLTVKRHRDIVLQLPATALTGVDLSKASFAVAMMGADENPAISNVRQAYDCTDPANASWVPDWRFCGGLGHTLDALPFDSDITDPNVIKTFVPAGVSQSDVLAPRGGGAILPFVGLTVDEPSVPCEETGTCPVVPCEETGTCPVDPGTPVAVTVSAPTLSKLTQAYNSVANRRATLTARVTGATGGVVAFNSGSRSLGQAPVRKAGNSYVATLVLPATLPRGTYANLTAHFTAPDGRKASSAASKQTLRVVKAKTSSVKIVTKKFKKGTRPTLRVKIATLTNGRQATGRVRIKVGKKTVRTVKVVAKNKGSVTVRLPKRYRATIKVKATYVPTPKASVEGKASKVVKVRATR